jgi:polyhydroxybutyrate depolymerase
MRRLGLLLSLVPFFVGCARLAPVPVAAADTKPGTHGTFPNEPLTVGKQKRTYRLVVPKSVDLDKPAPLVVAFHGMLIDSKDVMPKYTKLDELAAEKKFILAYPEAEGKLWGIAPDKVPNDLAFFDELLKSLRDKYRLDPDRVYVLGMSNGGYFAHLVGKERSKTVAAVCGHSTALGLQTLFGIKADRKFPVMIVHGDKDIVLSVDFARENRDKYKKEGHPVNFVEIAGLGHEWATKQKINEQIWEFFEKNPRK